ncbi:G-type lectin S-receptor-like serine/threonine-protein kinase At2g19130 [Zingiber officinale]|uniref:G-type lectin S-receptor-like serine/threonine-protein kinase At2g19130 n=1 Tax=Zingiber officinale TaxID=94328 RepID=UPI001C4ADAEA|nr:G-type lectin S-receptor-like serine/threonine-protein kinase At2g19130 [Zingiber officinale]
MAMAPSNASATSFFLLFYTLSLFLLSFTSAATSTDTISAQHSLTGNHTITSGVGTFVLGFFAPPGSGGNYYIGIWYGQVSVLTPAWVANRVTPVTDPTMSELKISNDGNLVLLDQFKSIIWSTNVTAISSSNSTVAVILDNGNLQLRDGSNSSLVFWQSFDHPTDTWLPGAKLGFNKITKRSQHLTSWKNKVDPSPGIFTFEMDPTGSFQYLFLWNLSRIYWASGLWNGHEFSSVTETPSNYRDDMQVVNHTDEIYITYTEGASNLTSRLVLDYDSGQNQVLVWMEISKSWMLVWSRPRSKCTVYAVCGPFGSCSDFTITAFCNCVKGFRIKSQTDWDLGDRSQGCERKTGLQCSGLNNDSADSEKDGFFEMPNVRLPDNPNTLATVASREGCELACLSNCSCSAYSYNGSGCFVWHGGLLNLQEQYNQSDAGTLYLRLAASELQYSERNKKRVVRLVIISVTVLAILFSSVPAILIVVKKRETRRMIEKARATQSHLVSFTYSELQQATRKFSTKLGRGGFGSVFKGSLPGSNDIAVKKLEGLCQGEKQFRTEVSTVGRIQHVNLVRLLGFCSQGSKRLLVYEFMSNGSLDSHLFHNAPSSHLNWKTRYQIAIGIARGIAYLHEQCRECIIHCDIKPENILLDASFKPKVADFGLAKLMGRDFSRVLTTLRGTKGYLAPEWITGVAITAKADVYSYGMVLLEIISGRRNLEQTIAEEDDTRYFPTFAASKMNEGDAAGVLDSKLGPEEVNMEELDRACKIACWCIQDDERCRPTMGQVVQVLEGIIDVHPPPIPRSLLLSSDVPEPINFFFECSSSRSTQVANTTSNCSKTGSHTSSSSDNK